MKHLLWDFMEAETRLPAKAAPVGGQLAGGSEGFSALCNTTGDLLDEAEILPTYSTAKVPLLLLAALIFLPQLLIGSVKQKVTEVFSPRPLSGPPLYLKLGQLIYYC